MERFVRLLCFERDLKKRGEWGAGRLLFIVAQCIVRVREKEQKIWEE